jgi:hypothetical protein
VFTVLFAAVLAVVFSQYILDLAHDYGIGQSGMIAVRSRVSTTSCSAYGGVLLPDCTVWGSYVSADGMSHDEGWHYLTVVSTPGNSKFLVRYDPARPAVASTSWGVDLLVERTIALGLFALPAALIIIYFTVKPWREWVRIGRKVAAIGADPTPVEVTVTRYFFCGYVPWGRFVEFYWTDTKTGQMFFDETLFKGTPQPFWLDAPRTRMLALARNGQAHLLDAALATVSLTDGERSIILHHALHQ